MFYLLIKDERMRVSMQRRKTISIIVIGICLLTLITACHKQSGGSSQPSTSLPGNSNNAVTKSKDDSSSSKPTTTDAGEGSRIAVLQGTYKISEVQHDGIVEMISPENSTEITFKQPSSFSRQSKISGKVTHTDSGQFQVEGDKLILKIVMSKNQLQVKPVEKRFAYTLSADGEELKLTSDNNKTAVFRRTKALSESKS
jgi:hypothetical protein